MVCYSLHCRVPDEIVENIPVNELTVLEMNEHAACCNARITITIRKKPRRKIIPKKKLPDKEWYQGQLHEALLKKFKIKK
jgi:hypothetical protein